MSLLLRFGFCFLVFFMASCAPLGCQQLGVPSENIRAQVEQSFMEA
jgi:hypothetical protein